MPDLPKHPKKHHKPFRWRHLALFLAGLCLGLAATYRSGYITEPRFDINSISPATVKIHHFVCGVLVIDGQKQGKDVCDGNTGTGFLVSSDGYIATSGHVIVRDAADVLVSELQRSPGFLREYALGAGLSDKELFNPESVNKLMAGIYDLPPERLRLDNKKEITLAALGSQPLGVRSQADIRALFGRADSALIKKTEVVATDFSAKDLFVIEQAGQKGFSSSDIALLKANVHNAPFIRLTDTTYLRQNEPISVLGFPVDAENQLTSNSTLSPSVTNGTISSIRTAKGSDSRLFQTDADASQGSSGGPAVNDEGEAVGIVTYRFKDHNQANAAKSYIRDIADLQRLIGREKISLNTTSLAQDEWEKALELASQNKFSAALEHYQAVQSTYPAHRLVNDYGNSALRAIGEGKDVKEVNYLAVTAGVGAGGFLALSSASVLIARHHRHHRNYRDIHRRRKNVISPTTAS